MLGELLFLMGEELVIETKRRESGVDRELLKARLEMTPTERIETVVEAASAN